MNINHYPKALQTTDQSLSLSKLNYVTDASDEDILTLVKAQSKGDLYTKFIKAFLHYIPIDYRSKDKIFLFSDFVDNAFNFFQYCRPDNNKIAITHSNYQNNPAIDILINTAHKPFIMDSLNCLFSRLNLVLTFTFHPIINCSRGQNGDLQEIYPNNNEGTGEELVFIKIVGNFDDHNIESLKKDIYEVINLVNETSDSWQNLLDKLITINIDIANNQELYNQNNLPTSESLDFLNWIQNNNFTFLGMIEFDTKSENFINEEGVKKIWQDNVTEIKTIINYSTNKLYSNKLIITGKINVVSPVHRGSLVDYILIKKLDKNGNYSNGNIILGLYGNALYYQSIKTIPILREKMNYVLDKSSFSPSGYNAKKLNIIIESLPRETLIQISEQDLYHMCLHMLSSMRSHLLKLFIQQDWSGNFLNVIIFLPREKLTPEAYRDISNYLSEKFESTLITSSITVIAQNFTHFFTTLAVQKNKELNFDSKEIENDLIKITTTWSDALLIKLNHTYGEYKGNLKYIQMESLFPSSYRHKFNATETIDDFNYLLKATETNKTSFNLTETIDNNFSLKIYNPEEIITLSEILPSIENLGFIALDAQSFMIKESNSIKKSWIYQFILSSPSVIEIAFSKLKNNIELALEKITEGTLTSDSLCKLSVLSGLHWTQVKLLRALTRYLHQTAFSYGKGYVQLTLLKHYKFTETLIQLFDKKFNPKTHSKSQVITLSKEILSYLDNVNSSSEDKVLRSMYLLIEAIIRTNYYQSPNDNEIKDYLSFKFNSSKVPGLPLPIPHTEIFVYSSDFEGVHLRGGKVARGGLRWSDRGEDYRTEILGLMKSQMTKNTVIVPVGAKGGFFVNFEPDNYESQNEYMAQVITCYQNFLRGILDITDNLLDNKIINPINTITYDEDDPYLVVAADKGTAAFSDHANAISKEYNFWLEDAFGSGGSVGYDHKKMGITAKGAWVSVQSHFQDLGIDVQKTPFSVVAIGDMSGDVFGNGMLRSKFIKLIAAFNHQHIFIDPIPNPEISYKERERLFVLPRSKWSDYNIELISRGGGIFDRSSKALTISVEIQELLDLSDNVITPDYLIKAILKAQVNLIWNGGIGTYIKSSSENNFDIGDKTNDNLRCNANEIRAQVIAEGGNLGVSQLGRIEYELNGGLINTDFIDNSAGVGCSDLEVNIKIALSSAIKSGKITIEERNKLLEQMTNQVEDLVLLDNYDQNQALTTAKLSTSMNLESFEHLIKSLEQSNLLNSKIEFLPSKAELTKRAMNKEGMTRAELAVLLSYSKISADNDLSDASLAKDEYFDKHLLQYFPPLMLEKFQDEINNHPLRDFIIKTMISNKMINRLGGPTINTIKQETDGELCDIARAFFIICEVFNLDILWQQVENLNKDIPTPIKAEMFSDISKIMRRGISWFIRNEKYPLIINKTIAKYSEQTKKLSAIIHDLLIGESKTNFHEKIEHYKQYNIDLPLAQNLASLDTLVSAFDIIHLANLTKESNNKIAHIYFTVGDIFNIDWLRKSCEMQISDSYWNRLSIQSLKDDLYDKQRRLISFMMKETNNALDVKEWLQNNHKGANIFIDFVNNIKTQEIINLNMLILANKKFDMFLRKLR